MARLPLSSFDGSEGASSGYTQAPPVALQNPQMGRWLSHFVFRLRQTVHAVPARRRAYDAASLETGASAELGCCGTGSMAGTGSEAACEGIQVLLDDGGIPVPGRVPEESSERMLASRGSIAVCLFASSLVFRAWPGGVAREVELLQLILSNDGFTRSFSSVPGRLNKVQCFQVSADPMTDQPTTVQQTTYCS
jgi:hypothetical protein